MGRPATRYCRAMPAKKHRPQLITAVFQPKERKDLHPACLGALGKRLTWMSQGRAPEPEYPGQLAWFPVGLEAWPGWVPSEDLADVEPVIVT